MVWEVHHANNPPTTQNTKTSLVLAGCRRLKSTQQTLQPRCGVRRNIPTISGKIVFAERTMIAKIAADTGLMTNERWYLLTIFLIHNINLVGSYTRIKH